MTTLVTTRNETSRAGLGAFVSRTVAAIAGWNDRRATRNALSRLSDRELEDIGLTRGDIDAIARKG